MIVNECHGDIFVSTCQTITVTTNGVGVMGAGIAKTAKERYPEMFRQYRDICQAGEHDVGQLAMYPTPSGWLLLFPTKRHWRNPSKLEWIEWGLQTLVGSSFKHPFSKIETLAMAPLGCGHGGLNFDRDVRPLIYQYLHPWHVGVDLYLPRQ